MTQKLGSYEGMDYSVTPNAHGGFHLTITSSDTGETLFDKRMLMATVYEAILSATTDVTGDDGLTGQLVADALGIEMSFFDEED